MTQPQSNGHDADTWDDTVHVAARVAELPEPYVPSQRRKCATCGEEVWVADGGLALADSIRILCVQCVLADLPQ
jgi:hypothetical protein